jgi:hypothetical protein
MIKSIESPSPWTMLEADKEVGHLLHDKHRVVHGVQVTAHKNGVAILGGPVTEMFNGYGVRKLLAQVMPLLDGEHTIEQIEAGCPEIDPRQIRDIVGNLFMSGLLRTGSAAELVSNIDVYLDRIVGGTGVHRSGRAASRSLRSARLAVFAPDPIAQRLAALFAEIEGGATAQVRSADELDADTDLLLSVSVPGSADPQALFERANRLGVTALNLEIAGRNARIGPLVLARTSASYACYLAGHARLSESEPGHDPHTEMFWSAAALHMVASILTRTIKRPLINAYQDHVWSADRQLERRTTIARLHGWDEYGAAVPLGLASDSPGYEAWKQYCGIALQTRDWHPANSYLMHFKTENILSIFERVPAVFSGANVALPRSLGAAAPDGRVSLCALGVLATNAVGFQLRDGAAHRLAPTGGGLGSTLLLLLVREASGVEPGCYWVDAQASHLERMKDIDLDAVFAWLGVDPAAPAVAISFANVLKVARKYGPFSVNIGWYDSGVLLAYMRNVAAALGLCTVDHPRPQTEALMERLGLPASVLMPTGVIELAAGDAGGDEHARASGLSELLGRIIARRATRTWSVAEVNAQELQRFAPHIDRALSRHASVAGLDIQTCLLMLLKRSDAEDGFYSYHPDQGFRLIRAFERVRHMEILSQERLTDAPMILFPRIDLGAALAAAGDAGVETAYRTAGAVVGDLWLNAALSGFAGTACGGAFEGAIRNATGNHGLDSFSPLALCLGASGGDRTEALHA